MGVFRGCGRLCVNVIVARHIPVAKLALRRLYSMKTDTIGQLLICYHYGNYHYHYDSYDYHYSNSDSHGNIDHSDMHLIWLVR